MGRTPHQPGKPKAFRAWPCRPERKRVSPSGGKLAFQRVCSFSFYGESDQKAIASYCEIEPATAGSRTEPLPEAAAAILFGFLTDMGIWLLKDIVCTAYWQQAILCAAGIVLVGIGVSAEVAAGVVTLAGEGLVLAFSLRQNCNGIRPFQSLRDGPDASALCVFVRSAQYMRRPG